ncbi:unnamed protein product [Effrenium voratum]|nr:unnamed protein product [Effrenium voratum]
MTKSERLGQGQSLAARTKKAEEAFLARFRNPGRSKPPQRLPRSQSAQRRTEAGTHRSQEHANLRARAEDSQDVQEQLDSVAAASGLPISDKVTHDTEIQSPIDGLKQECADRPALAELQNKTCDLSKASIKDLRKASVGHGEEELAEEFPKVAEEEDTITVLPPLPGDGHGAPTPGLDAVLQSALEQVVEEAKACFDEAPHSTDDAFPTGFLEEVLRRGTDRMLDSPTCERTRTWREIKGQQDEAVHGDNARDRRCAPELTRSQEDTCFVAKLLQEAEVALREGSNDSLLWDTAQSCTAVSCLPRTLCDSPKVCQERQTQPSNEDGSAVPVEEALPLDDDMDQPKEEAVKTSPWTEQNHSPNISLEEGQEQPYEDGSAVPVEEALPLDDDMDQPKEEAVKTSPWTEQNHSPNISLEEGQEQPYEDGSAALVEEALLRDDDMDQPREEAAKTSPWSEQNHSPNISLQEGQEQPYEDGSAALVEEALPLDDDMDQPKEEAVKTSPWTEQNHSPNISLEEALPLDDDMDQPKEEAVKTSPWTEQNHSPNISLEEGQEQPYEDGSAALVEEALPLDDDMDQPKEEAVKTSPWTEQNHSPNISLEASLRGDLLMGQVKESAGSSSLSTLPDSMKVSLEEHRSQPFGRADFPPEEASLRDELLMGEPKESAVISSLSIMPDSLKISVSQLQEQQEQPSDEDGGALPLEEASSQDDSFIRQPEEETLDLASLHRLCEQRLSAATRPSVLDVISEDELTDTSALAAATLAGRLAARSGFASSLQEEYTFSSAGGSDAAGTHAPDGLDSLELGGRRDVDPMRSDGAQDKPVALQAEKERLQDAMESADEPGEDGQSHSSPENAKTVSQRKQPRQPRQQQKLSSSFDQLIENADAKIFVPNTLKASAPEPTLPTFVQGEGEGAEGAEGGSQRIHHQSLEHGSGEASSSGPKNPKLKVDKATWLQAGASSAASTALSLARRYGLSLAVLAAGCAYMTAVEMAWQLGPEPEWFA